MPRVVQVYDREAPDYVYAGQTFRRLTLRIPVKAERVKRVENTKDAEDIFKLMQESVTESTDSAVWSRSRVTVWKRSRLRRR